MPKSHRSVKKSSRKRSLRKRSASPKRSVKKSASSNTYILKKLGPTADKKYQVILPTGRSLKFGANGYSDYTKHKDNARKERYISRHQKRENWTKSGIGSNGFWSRWILWNKPSLSASIQDTQRKFHIKISSR